MTNDNEAEDKFPLAIAAQIAFGTRSTLPVRRVFRIACEAEAEDKVTAIKLFEGILGALKGSNYTIPSEGGGGYLGPDYKSTYYTHISSGFKPLSEDDRLKLLERAVFGEPNAAPQS